MSINALLTNDNYIIVLDTNILLNVYRYSPEFSDFALECLKTVSDYIILPATVRLEYGKHCRAHFSKMEKRVAEAGKDAVAQIKSAKNRILKSCDNLERLKFNNIDELKNCLSAKLDEVKKAYDDFFDDRASFDLIQNSWDGTDHLQNLVCKIETDGRVMSAPIQEEIYKWCDDGEKRYKESIPPGFEDSKKKDGVRKYSDLIIWKEILRFAKTNGKNIVFVTDDVKADWWETTETGDRSFHSKLIEEFDKTGQKIMPMTSQTFYLEIANDYSIEQTDLVEIALRMTDDDYCGKIADDVFETAIEDLIYNPMNYVSMESSHIESEGINEFEVTDHSFVGAERVYRDDIDVIYEFNYDLTVEGTSFEYWGRDEDTGRTILSDGRDHVFEGTITVQVVRETEVYIDFESDSSFESAEILDCELKEISFEDRPEPEGEFGVVQETLGPTYSEASSTKRL